MQIEPMPEKQDSYRVWLSEGEEQTLINHYDEEPLKQFAIELMFDGLRSEEVTRVSKNDFRQLDNVDEDSWVLRVWESKTGFRECPVSLDTKKKAMMLANIRDVPKDEPLVEVTTRTIQRWATGAAQELSEDTGNEDWEHVTAHDLRRSWATRTYYSLQGDRAKEIVMAWGGWVNEQTFSESYLGRPSDPVTHKMMAEAGLR